jgi:hypothetical protein
VGGELIASVKSCAQQAVDIKRPAETATDKRRRDNFGNPVFIQDLLPGVFIKGFDPLKSRLSSAASLLSFSQ